MNNTWEQNVVAAADVAKRRGIRAENEAMDEFMSLTKAIEKSADYWRWMSADLYMYI